MNPLTEKQKLPELKRRIKEVLAHIKESDINSHYAVYNGIHTIDFILKSEKGILSGSVGMIAK